MESYSGSVYDGVTRFDGVTFTRYSNTLINVPRVLSVAIDWQGNIWACGTAVGVSGISKYDGNSWTKFDHTNSNLPYSFNPVVTYANGQDVWVGGIAFALDSNLYQFTSGSWTGFLGEPSINSIIADNSGKIWVGSWCSIITKDIKTNLPETTKLCNEMSISPNPSNGSFTVSLETEKTETIQLKVFDLLGQLVKQENPVTISGNYTKQLNITQLPKGIYLLQIIADGQTISKRIEIQ
ncbi:MAG: T9SS type A sorting domain-containing protein [Chitinophagales bacterium]|nr:T9SS type A sorting domain-containing protein [Chitinophagales bacterium]